MTLFLGYMFSKPRQDIKPRTPLSQAPYQNAVTLKKRSHDKCCAGTSFTLIYPLGTNEVYYLSYLIFSKSIYHNSMHIQNI